MPKSIYKYQLAVKEKQVIELPKGADIIRIDDVDGQFFLWAIVETDQEHPKEQRFLECYKTGQAIETPLESLNYIGFAALFIGQELCLYFFENLNQVKCTENCQDV